MNNPPKARDVGLLHLFTPWAEGAVILAGTAVHPRPAFRGLRVPVPCDDCETTVFGDDEADAADRLHRHRAREHPDPAAP